uniref:Uncharacterized protein n=1 Tax=Arundo donax TaxID=35708 RepID=A0A0A8ZIC8_ARUDO
MYRWSIFHMFAYSNMLDIYDCFFEIFFYVTSAQTTIGANAPMCTLTWH